MRDSKNYHRVRDIHPESVFVAVTVFFLSRIF
jgi:hypothetical protein